MVVLIGLAKKPGMLTSSSWKCCQLGNVIEEFLATAELAASGVF